MNDGVWSASKRAAEKMANKTKQAVSAFATGVRSAIDAVSQFPKKIKEFFSKVIDAITNGVKSLAETLAHHPEVVLRMMCNFIGSLVGGAALPALVAFLTGGASSGELFAKIGSKIATWSGKLGKLGNIFSMANRMGKPGVEVMMKIANGVDHVKDATIETIQRMSRFKLNKMAMEAAACGI
jgi:phage-related protein